MTKRELEVKDPDRILEILNKCKVVHIGLVDDGMPYIVPMNYGYTMEDGNLSLCFVFLLFVLILLLRPVMSSSS